MNSEKNINIVESTTLATVPEIQASHDMDVADEFESRPPESLPQKKKARTKDEVQKNIEFLLGKELRELNILESEPNNPNDSDNDRETEYLKKLDVRGFSFDHKGKVIFNVNQFVDYVLTRMNIKYLQGKFWVYDRAGYWREVPKKKIEKSFWVVICEANNTIWTSHYAREAMALLKTRTFSMGEMNFDRRLLNFENGMMDLLTMELKPHDPRYLSSIRIPINYNPDADCPQFQEFLDQIFNGDKELIDIIQELMGYFTSTENIIQSAFYFLGPGSNGKTVLTSIIACLCGVENVSSTRMRDLNKRFGLQDLPNKTLNISAENEFDDKAINTEILKAITGGDSLNVEKKYKDSSRATLYCKLLMLLNNLPNTKDLTYGYFRRVYVIPFNQIFSEKKGNIDRFLLEKLYGEIEGILVFALAGLSRLRANGFQLTESRAVVEQGQLYQEKQNPVIPFCRDRVEFEVSEKCATKRSAIFPIFQAWCRENDCAAINITTPGQFLDALAVIMLENDIPFESKKIKGEFRLKYIRVREQDKPETVLYFDRATAEI